MINLIHVGVLSINLYAQHLRMLIQRGLKTVERINLRWLRICLCFRGPLSMRLYYPAGHGSPALPVLIWDISVEWFYLSVSISSSFLLYPSSSPSPSLTFLYFSPADLGVLSALPFSPPHTTSWFPPQYPLTTSMYLTSITLPFMSLGDAPWIT